MMTHTGYDSTQTQTKILVLYTAFIVLSYLDSSWVTFDHLVDSGHEIWPLLGHFWPFQNSILQQYQNIFDRREITSHIFLNRILKKLKFWHFIDNLTIPCHNQYAHVDSHLPVPAIGRPVHTVHAAVHWPLTNPDYTKWLLEFGAFTEFLFSLSCFSFPGHAHSVVHIINNIAQLVLIIFFFVWNIFFRFPIF